MNFDYFFSCFGRKIWSKKYPDFNGGFDQKRVQKTTLKESRNYGYQPGEDCQNQIPTIILFDPIFPPQGGRLFQFLQ